MEELSSLLEQEEVLENNTHCSLPVEELKLSSTISDHQPSDKEIPAMQLIKSYKKLNPKEVSL
jgi:hypothetical protein